MNSLVRKWKENEIQPTVLLVMSVQVLDDLLHLGGREVLRVVGEHLASIHVVYGKVV
jgi:hypothetical protein